MYDGTNAERENTLIEQSDSINEHLSGNYTGLLYLVSISSFAMLCPSYYF